MHGAQFDEDAARRLQLQLAADFAGTMTSALAYIGDRLGLFRTLADGKARSSQQLADECGLVERYVREWASALVASEYLTYDAQNERFRMTPAEAAVLTDETNAMYFGGSFLYAQACMRQVAPLMDAFRNGGGVSFAAFGPEISEAIQKLYANGYRDAVAGSWIPALPELEKRLEAGARVADVGCGGGRALLAVASRYPASRYMGFDLDPTSLDRAHSSAVVMGVSDRVTFELRRAEELPAEPGFDLVMAFNCVHDMAQPLAALRGIRRALVHDGWFLWSEAPVSDRLEENTGLSSRLAYGASCMHCMTVSLADGGVGLGVVVGAQAVRRMAEEAGFSSCGALPVEHPQHRVYVLRP
jgi:SAM-dependent methyltransferase